MERKHQNVRFLSNENWLNDLAFLNLKLQGKGQPVNKMFQHICAFEKKLELFLVQLSRGILRHFKCLTRRKLEFSDLNCTTYGASVQKLREEFANRFRDFRREKIRLKLFAHPFDLEVEDCPDDCQIELIELQVDMENKMKYFGNSLEDFYKLYVCNKYPNLSRHTKRMISLFGSTYCCEQFFFKMKLTKTRCRSRLINEHLISQLRVATSVKADINKLCTNSKFQVSH